MTSLTLQTNYLTERAYQVVQSQLRHPKVKGIVNKGYSFSVITAWGEISITTQDNLLKMSYQVSTKAIILFLLFCGAIFPFIMAYLEYQTVKELEQEIAHILNNA